MRQVGQIVERRFDRQVYLAIRFFFMRYQHAALGKGVLRFVTGNNRSSHGR